MPYDKDKNFSYRFRTSTEQVDLLKEQARRERISASELVRKAISQYISSQSK